MTIKQLAAMWVLLSLGLPVDTQAAPDKISSAAGFECSITAVTCGSYVTTATEANVCGVIEVAKFGRVEDRFYGQVSFFAGVRAGQEVLLLGGASAKAGMLITCKLPFDKQGKPDYERLKRDLPALIATDPNVRKQFPGFKRVELDKQLEFAPLGAADAKKVRDRFKK